MPCMTDRREGSITYIDTGSLRALILRTGTAFTSMQY